MPDAYRSYIVRVRRPRTNGEQVRVEIEDLLRGRRREVDGTRASDLGDGLAAIIDTPSDAERWAADEPDA